MKKLFAIGLGLLMIVVGVVAFSPYMRLYQLKKAYEAGEYAKVVSYVDFESVRPALKNDLTARLDSTLANNTSLLGLTQLFPDLGATLSEKVHSELSEAVDGALTPRNIEQLLAGEMSDETKKLAGLWAVASDYVDYEILFKDVLLMGMDKAIKNHEPIIKKKATERLVAVGAQPKQGMTMRYCGFDCFYVKGELVGQPVAVYLARKNWIDWQIRQVVLP